LRTLRHIWNPNGGGATYYLGTTNQTRLSEFAKLNGYRAADLRDARVDRIIARGLSSQDRPQYLMSTT
jgi:hypothetical protein